MRCTNKEWKKTSKIMHVSIHDRDAHTHNDNDACASFVNNFWSVSFWVLQWTEKCSSFAQQVFRTGLICAVFYPISTARLFWSHLSIMVLTCAIWNVICVFHQNCNSNNNYYSSSIVINYIASKFVRLICEMAKKKKTERQTSSKTLRFYGSKFVFTKKNTQQQRSGRM